MQTTSSELRTTTPARSTIATITSQRTRLRKVAFFSSAIAGPAVVGVAAARIFGSRRAGFIAGGVTALGLGAFRWQLQRLFNDQPDYQVERRIGRLEIRRVAARVEARTTIETESFNDGLEHGFERLFGYISGSNTGGEELAMTSPVTAMHRDGFTVGFVMPPERTRDSLPAPVDDRVLLCEVPERRVAVLRFHGRYNADNVGEHEVELLRLVSETGLSPFGPVGFAGCDPPTTLPLLRRNEVSVEVR
jgi:hypothetical protein